MTFEIKNVYDGQYGIKFAVTFTLKGGAEITVYGCRVVEGRKGDFIGWPSYKDNDGNYWNHVWVDLEDEDTQEILNAVYEKLDEEKPSKKHSKKHSKND